MPDTERSHDAAPRHGAFGLILNQKIPHRAGHCGAAPRPESRFRRDFVAISPASRRWRHGDAVPSCWTWRQDDFARKSRFRRAVAPDVAAWRRARRCDAHVASHGACGPVARVMKDTELREVIPGRRLDVPAHVAMPHGACGPVARGGAGGSSRTPRRSRAKGKHGDEGETQGKTRATRRRAVGR